MAEYTYEDIIMNPEDPRLEGAIGKDCYFSDYPKMLLDDARNSLPEDTFRLKNIRKDLNCPFIDENGVHWPVIIIKKEEHKTKHVPFRTKEEFLDAYFNAEYVSPGDNLWNLSRHGIWVKQKNPEAYGMVTEIWEKGIVIGICKTTWEELLKGYTFIDGSPCGKEVE